MKKENVKKQRPHQVSKGTRRSSMKTAGLHDLFIRDNRRVKPGWTAKQVVSLQHFMVEWNKQPHDEE